LGDKHRYIRWTLIIDSNSNNATTGIDSGSKLEIINTMINKKINKGKAKKRKGGAWAWASINDQFYLYPSTTN
jgi:hypothetical protein